MSVDGVTCLFTMTPEMSSSESVMNENTPREVCVCACACACARTSWSVCVLVSECVCVLVSVCESERWTLHCSVLTGTNESSRPVSRL